MRILKLSIYYYPDKTGIAVTNTEVAEWFASQGNTVEIITGLPFYPEWKIKEEYLDGSKWNEEINGVIVKRVRIYVPKSVNTSTRMIQEFSFVVRVFFKAFTGKKPDVIIVVSPPLTLGLIGILLKKIWRIKMLLNVKDLMPDAAIELNMIRNPALIKIFYNLERYIYANSDIIGTCGPSLLRRIEKKDVRADKLAYLPDTLDPQLLTEVKENKEGNRFLIRNKLPGGFYILHAGNMGVKQGMEVILDAADLLRALPIHFLLVGDGAVKVSLLSYAEKLKLRNVLFLPLQPREILRDMYQACHISLVTQKNSVIDTVVPGKIITSMAVGNCIITSAHASSEAGRMTIDADCGMVVEAERADLLSEAIKYFFENQKVLLVKAQNARRYAKKHFERETIMRRYEGYIQRLCKCPAAH